MQVFSDTCKVQSDCDIVVKNLKKAGIDMKQLRPYPILSVSKKAEHSILNGHPWVYDAEVRQITGTLTNGCLVDVIPRHPESIWGLAFIVNIQKYASGCYRGTLTINSTLPSGHGESVTPGSIAKL